MPSLTYHEPIPDEADSTGKELSTSDQVLKWDMAAYVNAGVRCDGQGDKRSLEGGVTAMNTTRLVDRRTSCCGQPAAHSALDCGSRRKPSTVKRLATCQADQRSKGQESGEGSPAILLASPCAFRFTAVRPTPAASGEDA
jgi:hypothetical protein